jgi:hypothetical protein
MSQKMENVTPNTRTRRSADVGSDHHLVVAVVKLKFQALKREKQGRIKYNVKKLAAQQTRNNFQLELQNRFQELQDKNPLPENATAVEEIKREWENTKQAYLGTCQEVLGKMKRTKKPCITEDTLTLTDERRNLKGRIDQARTRNQIRQAMRLYNDKCREVRRSCKRDKRRCIENLAQEAEGAASTNNMKGVYNITRKLWKK